MLAIIARLKYRLSHRMNAREPRNIMRHLLPTALIVLIVICLSSITYGQQESNEDPWQTYDTSNGEWRSYAGDIRGTKYSPLDQIDGGNFSDLEIAWEWLSVDNVISRSTPGGGEWWAPLSTIVDSLVTDTPDLYRSSQPPIASRLQATP